MKGLSKVIKYRKYIIKPIAVGTRRYCEISYSGGEPFAETAACPDILQAVNAAKELISFRIQAAKMAYFDLE